MSDLSDNGGRPLDTGEMVLSRKKRTSLEVTADVLDAAMEGAKKTTIMYRAKLSHDLLNRYLDKLVASDLLLDRDELGLFRIAPRGLRFLKEFKSFEKSRSNYLRKERSVNGFFNGGDSY